MNKRKKYEQANDNPEIRAIETVYKALKVLAPEVQMRVLRYSSEMLGLTFDIVGESARISEKDERPSAIPVGEATTIAGAHLEDDVEGINPVALKWMRRTGLNPKSLQTLFSLGVYEIDLVAKTVPGRNKKQRMRSVLLLKGIAAYLGTGAPRITYEQLKEACLHYAAYDPANFAAYLKSFASEVAGTKEAGFTLTARGLNSGTELVKEVLNSQS
jgi:hypothetical protein